MKKSIVIIVGVIYIASIIFIGFFGMKMTAYNPTVYPTSIVCTNEEAVQKEGYKYIVAYYDPNKIDAENVYQILYKVNPDDCTNKKVIYVYDKSSSVASVDEFGRVWIKKSGFFDVTIQSESKSSIQEKIMFYFAMVN